MSAHSLRHRLALYYGVVFALLLLLFIGVAIVVHDRQLVAQVFHGEVQDIETAEGLLYETPDGRILMHEDYFNQPRMPMQLERYLEVLDSSGNVLFRNSKLGSRAILAPLLNNEGTQGYDERLGRLSDGRSVYLISHSHRIGARWILIRLAYERAPVKRNVLQFALILLLLAPFTIMVAVTVVYKVTGSALAPLHAIVRRADEISAESLHARLPVEDPRADLGQLAVVVNRLLERLENSFVQLKQFTADASHELRTPLSSLRSTGEVCLQEARTEEEYCDTIASMLEEVNRLTQLVDSLLQISRADSGQIQLTRKAIQLAELVRESVDLVGILAEEKQQRIVVWAQEDLLVLADRTILRQAIVNLLDNAIKYSGTDCEIEVLVKQAPGQMAQIEIIDQGPGIPAEKQHLIFDRFYRTDEGRSADKGGAGLGLSIAKWAVSVHHGTIGVRPGTVQGCCFFMTIPLMPQRQAHGSGLSPTHPS